MTPPPNFSADILVSQIGIYDADLFVGGDKILELTTGMVFEHVAIYDLDAVHVTPYDPSLGMAEIMSALEILFDQIQFKDRYIHGFAKRTLRYSSTLSERMKAPIVRAQFVMSYDDLHRSIEEEEAKLKKSVEEYRACLWASIPAQLRLDTPREVGGHQH